MDNLYELMLVGNSKLSEAEEKKLEGKIADFLKNEGKILKKSLFGKKELAFPIKKEASGNFWLYNLQLISTEVNPFSQKLRMEESVLRFLLIKNPEVKTKNKTEPVVKVKKEKKA